ncbi:MAG: GIY-YIG nuclease family protein, partial [Gordonibacter sp.]
MRFCYTDLMDERNDNQGKALGDSAFGPSAGEHSAQADADGLSLSCDEPAVLPSRRGPGFADAGGFERLGDGDGLDAPEETALAQTAAGQAAKLARIKAELDSVPALPGVYLWKDRSGQVIYVGKAKQLRARMRQYVNFQDERAKIPLLVDQIDSFDYIVVENEHESLVLEKNLINQHSPFFNADFKDDKSYPFIALTKGDVFPAIKYTRERHKPDTKYFGPYTDSRAAREMVDIARRVVPLCATSCSDWRQLKRRLEKDPLALLSRDARPCFDAHVGL